MVSSPVRASLSINSILVARGMVFFSFCKPSRGPTSTSLTLLEEALAVAKPRWAWNWVRLQALQTADRKRDILGEMCDANQT